MAERRRSVRHAASADPTDPAEAPAPQLTMHAGVRPKRVPVARRAVTPTTLPTQLAVTKHTQPRLLTDTVARTTSTPDDLAMQALEHTSSGLLMVEMPGMRVLLMNAALRRFAVRMLTPARGRPADEDVHGRFVEWLVEHGVLPQLQFVAASGQPLRGRAIEGVVVEDSSEPLCWSFDVTPMRSPGTLDDGVPGGQRTCQLLLTFTDTTEDRRERRQAEHAIFTAQLYAEKLETAIEHLTEGVLILDEAGQLRAYNRAALSFARNREAVVRARMRGRRVAPQWDMTRPDGSVAPEGEQPSWQAMLTGEPVVGQEYLVQRGDGEETSVMISASPLRAEEGAITGAVVVMHDISAVKEIERLKDEFISLASHELRQPLTVIHGQAQMLKRYLSRIYRGHPSPEGDTLRSLVQGIESQAGRLNGLVSDLLDMSRIQIGELQLEPAPTLMLRLVEYVIDQQRDVSQSHQLGLSTVMVSGLGAAMGNWDERRVEQILMNLLSNAIKYSPDGGQVRIEIRVLPRGVAAAEVSGRRRVVGPAVEIIIRDQGIGIPEDALPHLFERFYRARNTAGIQGTGLGLYICRQLAWAHGGDLWAQSRRVGEGTAFHLVLPLMSLDGEA